MRKDSREAVYKLLFANLFNQGLDNEFIELVFNDSKLKGEDRVFARNLLDCVLEHYDETFGFISQFAKNYHLDRIFSTDKCALLIAMTEMKYFSDIPSVVSIDEAVSLVSKYSTEKSLAFVNGILGEYKKSLEENK